MHAGVNTLPESLSYLPAFFRAEVEPIDVVAHHPIRWLLQVFETNLHLAERIVEASQMLFDPEEVSQLPGKVCSSAFSERDIIDLRAFATKLRPQLKKEDSDKVSDFLWGKLEANQKKMLLDYELLGVNPAPVQDVLIKVLNKLIRSESIHDANEPDRFAHVKFSERTRALLKQELQVQQGGYSAETREAPEGELGEALVRLNRLLIEDAYPLEISAMPESSLLKFDNWQPSYMHWLASWVAVALDEEWLDDRGKYADLRYTKACTVIKNAPRLYRQRGTHNGLTEILALLYDWDVEIVERSWPRGLEIGVSSAIGLNCWLIDEINLEFQFTVLIRSTERNRDRLPDVGLRMVSELAGSRQERQIAWLWTESAAQPASDPGPEHKLAATVNKLRDLIDQEKPAHTCYYLALEETPEKKPRLPHLVIEVDSRIEGFWIN